MKATSEPELKRVPLEEVCLSILASGMGRSCHNFLDEAPQPPNSASVQAALSVLKDVGAITREDEALTPLGQHLARYELRQMNFNLAFQEFIHSPSLFFDTGSP